MFEPWMPFVASSLPENETERLTMDANQQVKREVIASYFDHAEDGDGDGHEDHNEVSAHRTPSGPPAQGSAACLYASSGSEVAALGAPACSREERRENPA